MCGLFSFRRTVETDPAGRHAVVILQRLVQMVVNLFIGVLLLVGWLAVWLVPSLAPCGGLVLFVCCSSFDVVQIVFICAAWLPPDRLIIIRRHHPSSSSVMDHPPSISHLGEAPVGAHLGKQVLARVGVLAD